MNAYIDIHNHSLPNIDDGAKSLEMALEMLRVAEENHTKEIVLTPHHLNGAFINSRQKIRDNFNELKEAAKHQHINIKLHMGSEVHLTPETAEQLLSCNAMSMCDLGKTALIELPKNNIPFGTEAILSKLLYNNIIPIIAHPERNTSLRTNPEPLVEWVSMGCKTQLTAMSCTGHFGNQIQEVSLQFIAKGLAHFIASDAHRPQGRSPKLQTAAQLIEKYFSTAICTQLLYDNPKRLTTGDIILDIPMTSLNKKRKKNRWVNFFKNKK